MLQLQSFPREDDRKIQNRRRDAAAAPNDLDLQVALALALTRTGCTYEAASILRPLRKRWKASESAQSAEAAIRAQAWWNRNWREFTRLTGAGNKAGALALLGDRAEQYWDLPPLLVHLGKFAAQEGRSDLARHLFGRVAYLSERGLPKMNMAAFAYVAQAELVDLMSQSGEYAAALDRHLSIVPNHGNAMGHEIQHASLLVAAGRHDEAMRKAALILMTAQKYRTGYSKVLRMEFLTHSSELAPLRARADWQALQRDPEAYLRRTKTQSVAAAGGPATQATTGNRNPMRSRRGSTSATK